MNQTGFHWELYTYATYTFRRKYIPRSKFIVFTIGRSGSSLLVSMLNSNPHIGCFGEFLGKKLFFPLQYLNRRECLGNKDVYGFKLNTYHFDVQKIRDPISFVGDLMESGYAIISLRRNNTLRQVISHIYAIKRDKFHHKANQGQQMHQQVFIDLKLLKQEFEEFEKFKYMEDRILKKFKHISVVYENDLSSIIEQQATIDRIVNHFGIESTPVKSDFVRTTPKDLTKIIKNYDEFYGYVMSTNYAKHLEE